MAGTTASNEKWRVRFENLSGPSILLYVILMTDFVIVFVKSLDVIWASSVYGLQFLVAQGYGVLALGILTLILLSRYEPIKTLFRTTEQHDLGKLAFAFVMLNIYLTFAEFLIIWSGNIPDELTYYLKRNSWRLVVFLHTGCGLPLGHTVLPAIEPRHQAVEEQDGLDRVLHDLRASDRYVLADRAIVCW